MPTFKTQNRSEVEFNCFCPDVQHYDVDCRVQKNTVHVAVVSYEDVEIMFSHICCVRKIMPEKLKKFSFIVAMNDLVLHSTRQVGTISTLTILLNSDNIGNT